MLRHENCMTTLCNNTLEPACNVIDNHKDSNVFSNWNDVHFEYNKNPF